MLGFLSALGLIVGIVAGGASVYKFLESRQHPAARQPGVIFGIVAVGMLLAAYMITNMSSGLGSNPTPTISNSRQVPGIAPTPTPTPSPTPSPTPVPRPETVLYQADWSRWTLSTDWSVLNGILINNGNGCSCTWLIAPYKPDRNDYAVEADIRVDRGCNSHGIVIRAVGSNNYAGGGYCGAGQVNIWLWTNNAQSYSTLTSKGFNAGSDWHTYRMEVKGNDIKLLIDGTLILETIDNTILSGGQVGLWSGEEQLEVRSFKVIAL